MLRQRMLTDEQWAKIEPLLPKLKSRGRPWRESRKVVEGILWILRTGARWRDLPELFPSPATCWRRLQRWERGRDLEGSLARLLVRARPARLA